MTGKNSNLLHAAASLILNAAKHLAGIPDSLKLLPSNITQTLSHFKRDVLRGKEVSLDLEETLISLSLSGIFNPAAQAALKNSNCSAVVKFISLIFLLLVMKQDSESWVSI